MFHVYIYSVSTHLDISQWKSTSFECTNRKSSLVDSYLRRGNFSIFLAVSVHKRKEKLQLTTIV